MTIRKMLSFFFAMTVAMGAFFANADEYAKGLKVRLLFVFDANAVDYLEDQGNTCDNFAGNCVNQMNTVLANSKVNDYFTYEVAGTIQNSARDAYYWDENADDGSGGKGAWISDITAAYNVGWQYLNGSNIETWAGVLEARASTHADIVVYLVYTGTSGGTTGQSHPYNGSDAEYAKNYCGSAFSVCSIQTAMLEVSDQAGAFQVLSHEVAHELGCGHADTQDNQHGPQSSENSSALQFRLPGSLSYTLPQNTAYTAHYGSTIMAYKEHFFKNEDGSYMTLEEAQATDEWDSNWVSQQDYWDNTGGVWTRWGHGIMTYCYQFPYFSSPDYVLTIGGAVVPKENVANATLWPEGTYVPMGDEKHNNRQVLLDNYQYASRWHLGVKFSKDGNASVVNGASDKISLAALSDNCTIYYTTDGTDPTKDNGTQYAEPFSLTQAATVKARSYDAQDNAGDVLSKTYTMLPLATALGNTELTWTTSSPAWYVDNGVARSALINDDGVTSTLSTVITGPAKLTFEYAAELMDSDVFAVTVGGTKVLEATEYNSEFASSGEIEIPEGEQTVAFAYTVNFNFAAENNIKLRNVSVQYENGSSSDPKTSAYTGPEPTAVWQTGEFNDAASDHGGYSIVLPDSGISVSDGKLVIASDATTGATIDLSSASPNKVTVLIEYSSLSAVSGKNVTLATVEDSESHVIGARTTANGALTLTGYYDAGTDNDYPFSTVPTVSTGTGYLMLMYDDTTDNGVNGTYCYAGDSIDALVGGRRDNLKWTGGTRKINAVSIGGPITANRVKAWPGVKIEKVALFVGEALTNDDIALYQFPEVSEPEDPQEPEEPTTGAKLVNGETVTYSDTIEGAIIPGLIMALNYAPINPDAYVQVLDPNAETPNVYGLYNIAYDSVNRRYCKAVTTLYNGTATYPAFLNLADAWEAAGKGADTKTITVLSDPSDAVVVGNRQTLRVSAGSADLSDNISFADGLKTSTWTVGTVTTYTARELDATLPGLDTNVGMEVGDFALDSTGAWAVIIDKPLYLTLDSPVEKFRVSFDVDIPDGYGTLFSWDSIQPSKAYDSRIVITNDASKMVVWRDNNGTLTAVSDDSSKLITSGQHHVVVKWVRNAGCTIYVDGEVSYSSTQLAFSNFETTKLAIGGLALGNPDDVLAGLKVKNFTYNVYTDAVTLLDGTIYHGNDENRAVITNYLSQMVGHRPVKMPAPATVDLLLVYDPNAVDYATNHYATVEEHAARSVAVMNQILTNTDIDTNAWFRIAGIYQVEVAAANVDDALSKLNAGNAEGWDQVNAERNRVGADVVLGIVYSNSNYGLANWCSPASIMNGNSAGAAFAGVRADAAWAWMHEVGHVASLYHNPGEAANSYSDPTSIGCGFTKTAEADMATLTSLMNSGTAQLAFSSPNHMSHGEVYSVTNASGQYVDSSGELARLLPYMAKYRDTKVNAWSIMPENGSTVKAGDTMTVTCEDPEATIWYRPYYEQTDTQYEGPIEVDTSYATCIYYVTIKQGDETVVSTTVFYTVDQSQADPVAKIGETPYDSLAAAVDAATASSAESVEISLLLASSDDVALDSKTTVTEASGGLCTGTLSGSGTLVLAGTRSSALSLASGWSGVVELPAFEANGQVLPHYCNGTSKVKLNGITGGYLMWNDLNMQSEVILAGDFVLTDMSERDFTFAKISGAGNISLSPGTYELKSFTIGELAEGYQGAVTNNMAATHITISKLMLPSGASVTPGTKLLATGGTGEIDVNAVYVGGVEQTGLDIERRYNGTAGDGFYVCEKYTGATGYPVPYSWLEVCFPGIEGYPDAMYETMAKSSGDNGYSYWESYVLGLEPTNALSKFTATIHMEGQNPVVEFSPTNEVLRASGEIEYILQGKPSLTNDWQDVGFDDPGDTNRFFRVNVKW